MRPVIIIIEDDAAVRRAISSLLRSCDFGVEEFASAEGFLVSPQPARADCMITDVHLPGTTGFELHACLVALHRSLPTLFITADADAESRQLPVCARRSALLRKPFEPQVLINTVKELCRTGHPPRTP